MIEKQSKKLLAMTGRGRHAFTLLEMLVASFILVIALLGIYEMYEQAVLAEATTTKMLVDSASSAAVADRLAADIETAVDLARVPGVAGGAVAGTTGHQMICLHTAPRGALRMDRYSWEPPKDPASPSKLMMQEMIWCGTRDIDSARSDENDIASPPWDRIPKTQIAEVSALAVQYQPAGILSKPSEKWNGPAAGVLVAVRVTIGNETVTRIAAPRVTQPLVQAKSEQ